MANPDWGTKHSCQSCGVKYYDLGRSPAACPKCGTEFNPDALLRSRRSRPAPAAKAPKPVVAAKPDAAAELPEPEDDDLPETEDGKAKDGGEEEVAASVDGEPGDDDAAGALIEDPSELGEDDDDVAEVVVGDDETKDT